jgi:hypothetical protein
MLAANKAGASSGNSVSMINGPVVQFGDCSARIARAMYPRISTEAKISYCCQNCWRELTETTNDHWNQVPSPSADHLVHMKGRGECEDNNEDDCSSQRRVIAKVFEVGGSFSEGSHS